MKAEMILYKFLSFLLLPIAAFFGLACLSFLLIALNYPIMLIYFFLLACMVIYIIASFVFLTKGIDNNKQCKPLLRDWIRINGAITFVFFLMILFSSIALKSDPSLMKQSMKQWTGGGNLPPGVNVSDLEKTMAATVNFSIALSAVVLVHVLITFHLMKLYRSVFELQKTDIES